MKKKKQPAERHNKCTTHATGRTDARSLAEEIKKRD
jgi:hypothetical protein